MVHFPVSMKPSWQEERNKSCLKKVSEHHIIHAPPMHQPMHCPMHGPACLSTQTPIPSHRAKPHLNYMILHDNIELISHGNPVMISPFQSYILLEPQEIWHCLYILKCVSNIDPTFHLKRAFLLE